MKVVTRHARAESLSPEAIARLEDAGVTPFALEIGRQHTVFGMTLTNDGLFVLILAGTGRPRPTLESIELFEVTDAALGKDWLFLYQHEKGSNIHGMWGYPYLIHGELGFDGLFSEKRLRSLEEFVVAARREDLGDRERVELEALWERAKSRSVPRLPPEGAQT